MFAADYPRRISDESQRAASQNHASGKSDRSATLRFLNGKRYSLEKWNMKNNKARIEINITSILSRILSNIDRTILSYLRGRLRIFTPILA
jgi:hypothetical protein